MRFKVTITGEQLHRADRRTLELLPALEMVMWTSSGVTPAWYVFGPGWQHEWRSIHLDDSGLRLSARCDTERFWTVVEGDLPDTPEAKAFATTLGALAQGHDLASTLATVGGPRLTR